MLNLNPKDLTPTERTLLGEHICQTNDGSMFMPRDEYNDFRGAAWSLAERGIIGIDGEEDDEVALLLTPEGEAWVKSLPEGSLGG